MITHTNFDEDTAPVDVLDELLTKLPSSISLSAAIYDDFIRSESRFDGAPIEDK